MIAKQELCLLKKGLSHKSKNNNRKGYKSLRKERKGLKINTFILCALCVFFVYFVVIYFQDSFFSCLIC